MNKTGKRFTSLLLVLILLFTSVFTTNVVRAEESEDDDTLLTWEVVENDPERSSGRRKKADITNEPEKLTGNVRVSIVLEGKSTLDYGYATEDISLNPAAQSYRHSLKETQDDMAATISRKVLNGDKLDVVWNLTLAANIISANVPAEKIDAIKKLEGVKDVVIEQQYEPQTDEVSGDSPNMSNAVQMTSANYAWAAGYTGAGSKIAIVDTGLDIDHQSFDGDALEYSIEEYEEYSGKTVELMDKNDVIRFWNADLNAYQAVGGTGTDAYLNSKVPYRFNYVDKDFDVTHLNDRQGEHGSHVAGIAAANKYIEVDGEMQNALNAAYVSGNAPDAQLMIMKVFGKGGGAYDSDYFAAIEDAIYMGADSVNLSLGSANTGMTYNPTYKEIIDGITGTNIIWANSAGNNADWAGNLSANSGVNYLYTDSVSFATGGSPATYPNTFSVASIDNDGVTGPYLSYYDDYFRFFYTETSGYGNEPMSSIAGDYEFVFVNGPGVDDNNYSNNVFAQLGREVLAGKIAVCYRGGSSFFAKANAAAAQGAAAVLIVNNQAGTISMNLSGYEYSVPVVSLTAYDGFVLQYLADEVTTDDGITYYTGELAVSDDVASEYYDSDHSDYVMSDFSSWGVPGDLSIKPEITTPGGNIYSVYGLNQGTTGALVGGHDQYEIMSGTSMASPQMAGIAAVMAQYVKDNGLDEQAERLGITRRALIQSLMMSTSEPLIESASESYYSIMKQGSGLADVENAINSDIVILMNSTAVNGEARKDISAYAKDGKVKAELGDDPERTGKYSVEFTLNNLTDESHYFELNGDFFTQDAFAYYTFDADGNEIFEPYDEDGNRVYLDHDSNGYPVYYRLDEATGEPVYYDEDEFSLVSTYLDTWTVGLNPSLTWYVNDARFEVGAEYDFDNHPEEFNDNDAKAVLDAVVAADAERLDDLKALGADMDGDGEVTTYDAYLILRMANEAATEVPAYATVKVRVDIDFGDELDDYDDNGTYVEGYLFVKEKDSEEGDQGIDHSIPVLGYYGSWDEPSMVDIGSVLEYEYGLEYRYPYLSNPVQVSGLGEDALYNQAFVYYDAAFNDNYVLGGNPIEGDLYEAYNELGEAYIPVYRPERNAFNTANTLVGAQYTLIRNAAGIRFDLTDADGNILEDSIVELGGKYAAFYNQNQGVWQNTTTSSTYGYQPKGLAEGSNVTLRFLAAPEYYYDSEYNILWDGLKPTWEMPLVIDNTAPVFESIFAKRIEPEEETGVDEDGNEIITVNENGVLITLSAYDNEYLAGLFIYDEDGNVWFAKGAREDDKTGPFDVQEYLLTYDSSMPDHLYAEAWDYAGNLTTARMNLNKEELSDPIEVTLDEEHVANVVGNSFKLNATVTPWGVKDSTLIWTSEDESIAVVNQNGIVTGVGAGTTVITATSHADPSKSDSCIVDLVLIERDLNGFIWDEEGEVWFSHFNTADIPDYDKLSGSLRKELTGAAYGLDGNLYVSTYDQTNNASSLLIMDETTYEFTDVVEPAAPIWDMCPAPSFGESNFHDAYSTFILFTDLTGDNTMGYNLADSIHGSYVIGVALDEQYYYPQYGTSADWLFVLDDLGYLYSVGFIPMDGTVYWFGEPEELGRIGNAVDTPFYQSLYYDGTDLYWSRFSGSENDVDIIFVKDLWNEGSIYTLGSFADGVWPVAGLFNSDQKDQFITESFAGRHADAVIDETVRLETVSLPTEFTVPSVGKLDSVSETPKAEHLFNRNDIKVDVDPTNEDHDVVTVLLKADGTVTDLEGRVITHNGLIEIEYDVDVLELLDVESAVRYYAVNDGTEGKVVFGFIDLEGVEYDDVVAKVTFERLADQAVDITVLEKEKDSETDLNDPIDFEIQDSDFYDWGDILPEDRPASVEDIPEGVWVSQISDLVYNGKAQKQEFRVYDFKTMLTEGKDYTVKYKNNVKAATADSAKAPTVTVTGKGNYKDRIVKTFTIAPKEINDENTVVVLTYAAFAYNGKKQKPTVSLLECDGVKLRNNADFTCTYENPDSTNVGTYKMTITAQGNYTGSLEAEYVISNDIKSVGKLSITGVKANMTYTGQPIYHDVVVKDGTKVLKENVDYVLEYRDNIDAGKGYVTIRGIGDYYAGYVTKSFKIAPAKLTLATTQVSGLPTSVEYCGEFEPEAVLTFNGRILTEGEDYTVTYKNNNKVGTATVTFKGIGNYTGSFNKTFKITAVTSDWLFAVALPCNYEKGGAKAEIIAVDRFNRVQLVEGKDFKVTYKNNTMPGEGLALITYKGNYSGTAEAKFEISAAPLSGTTLKVADKAYTTKKNGWKSAVTIVDVNGKKLTAVDYDKNVKYYYVSTGEEVGANDIPAADTVIRVVAEGKGNYYGTAEAEYRIVKGDVSKASVKILKQFYTGKPVEVSKDDITVKVGKDILNASDYQIISYENNVNKGTAKLTIKGVGNYGGTKTVSFKIVQKSFLNAIWR
ncbi:MAG: S8 family serine peptidase [Erysipelotrichaceae bacterium]|nr:S8 family serine peptidase [Erysipelotrichaceae bacterium]